MGAQQFVLYNPYPNQAVTAFYFDTVAEGLRACGFETVQKDRLTADPKNFGIVIATPKDYRAAKKAGFQHIFLWSQGIPPEESFMRNHSYLRKWILSVRDRAGLAHADVVFMVSQKMKEFLAHKYRLDFEGRAFLMPCFNALLDESAFSVPGKYEQNVFTYTGSLTRWQCFEETVCLYKKLEDRLEHCRFDVYTAEQEEAKKLLEQYGVRHYSVDFVSPAELQERLKQAKFGFVLREDTPVNRVATPTKLSGYLASGVIPIFSDCLEDFCRATEGKQYVLPLAGFEPEPILDFCRRPVEINEIREEYRAIFAEYYNREAYVSKIKGFTEKYFEGAASC